MNERERRGRREGERQKNKRGSLDLTNFSVFFSIQIFNDSNA
jgi:hypothetical protein